MDLMGNLNPIIEENPQYCLLILVAEKNCCGNTNWTLVINENFNYF